MTLHRLLPLVALALNALLIGCALAGDRKSQRNYAFISFAVALSIWNLGAFGLRSAPDAATALTWEWVLHIGVVPIPVLFYHYVIAFLGRPRRQPLLIAGYAICAMFLPLVPTALFMRGVTMSAWGYMPASGPLYGAFFVYFQVYLVIGLIALIRGYRSMTSSFRRNRARIIFAGASVSLVGGLIDFVRFLLGWEWLYPVGIPANAVLAFALGIAIIRYRLLDVKMVAKWAILYALTGATLGACLGAVLTVLNLLSAGNRFAAHAPALLAIAITLAVALPFLSRLQDAFEQLMFSRQHGVRDTLSALAKEMVSVLDLGRLGDQLTLGLVSGIPAMHASLFLRIEIGRFAAPARAVSPAFEGGLPEATLDDALIAWLGLTRKPLGVDGVALRGTGEEVRRALAALEAARVTLLVPLSVDGKLTAVLLLGEKLSGEIFYPAEIALLETLMAQTGIALRNSVLYADLQGRMNELAATQQQLIQSEKLAAIGELAASVAHEINNPLGIILGNSDLLARQFPPDTPPGLRIAAIQSAAQRAGKIVGNLLHFSRRREPKREPVSLNSLILCAIDLLGAKLRKAQVRVETAFDPAAPPVLGDADQLTQVLLNLMANACDAMPAGGALLVRTRFCAEPQAVAIDVVDRGVGMTPEQAARIFEPFYTTKGEGGTGLGLSVSLGIIRNHEGSFDVHSRPGQGTTMTVQLPVRPVPARAPEAVPV